MVQAVSSLVPPGFPAEWMLWDVFPPLSPDDVVELWRPEWRNETDYRLVGSMRINLNTHDLWWRPG